MSGATPTLTGGEPEAPLTPLSALLGPVLSVHGALLKQLGYDEVDDFTNITENELSILTQTG